MEAGCARCPVSRARHARRGRDLRQWTNQNLAGGVSPVLAADPAILYGYSSGCGFFADGIREGSAADGGEGQAGTRFSNPTLAFERVVAFSVVDAGIGIPDEQTGADLRGVPAGRRDDQPEIWGLDSALDLARDRAPPGRRDPGREASLGEGSVFTLYLPERYIGFPTSDEEREWMGAWRSPERVAPRAPSLPVPTASPPFNLAEIAGRKVLVVDDDVRNVFAMTSVLEAAGLEVVYADNGQAGIDALESDPKIDLVLMDVMMPGKDGYETIRAIRANAICRDKPVVAVTAKALEDDREKCIEAGRLGLSPQAGRRQSAARADPPFEWKAQRPRRPPSPAA